MHPPQHLHPPKTHVSWKAPPTDSFKINFDGAIFPRENKFGIRVVIRNSQGLVIASLSQQLPQAMATGTPCPEKKNLYIIV